MSEDTAGRAAEEARTAAQQPAEVQQPAAARHVRKKCPHGRQRSDCVECGGGGICAHRIRRALCKDCGGTSICQHNRVRTQ